MSQYIEFYIHHKEDYLELSSYSRSSIVYQTFEGAPYGHAKTLTDSELTAAENEIKTKLAFIKEAIQFENEKINLVCKMDNALTEKIELIEDLKNSINSLNDDLEEATYCHEFIGILFRIKENNEIVYGIEIEEF